MLLDKINILLNEIERQDNMVIKYPSNIEELVDIYISLDKDKRDGFLLTIGEETAKKIKNMEDGGLV